MSTLTNPEINKICLTDTVLINSHELQTYINSKSNKRFIKETNYVYLRE